MKKLFAITMLFICIAAFAGCSQNEPPQTEPTPSPLKLTSFKDEATGLFGYKDADGNIVIDCVFDRAGEFHNDRALVWKDKKCGYIDSAGQVVIDFIYKEAADFSNGRAVVKKEGKFGFIDTTGNAITDFIYDNATSFNASGYATVIKDGETFDIDKKGNEIIPDKE